MRYLLYFLLLSIFSTLLNAAEFRTIRVASFGTYEKASKAIEKFENSKFNIKLEALREASVYRFVVLRKGDYYVMQLEPFKDRVKVQEALDVIRLMYKDAYVNKIRLDQIVRQNASIQIIEKTVIKEKPVVVIKEKIIEKELLKIVPVKETIQITKETTNTTSRSWIALFIASFIAFLVALKGLVSYKKENKILEEEIETLEAKVQSSLFDDIDMDFGDVDIDFNDIDIDMNLDTSKQI